MNMFCIKCGKPATAGNFCDACFLKAHDLFMLKAKRADVKLCDCGRVFYKRWREHDDDWIKNVVLSCISLEQGATARTDISWKKIGNKYYVRVVATGKIKPCKTAKTEEQQMIVVVKKTMCDRCTKISGNYYEAVVQVRPRDKQLLESVLEELNSKNISGVYETEHGYDIRLINKKLAGNVIRSAKELGLAVKKSQKLIGSKDGRKLYRDFYSIKRKG